MIRLFGYFNNRIVTQIIKRFIETVLQSCAPLPSNAETKPFRLHGEVTETANDWNDIGRQPFQ